MSTLKRTDWTYKTGKGDGSADENQIWRVTDCRSLFTSLFGVTHKSLSLWLFTHPVSYFGYSSPPSIVVSLPLSESPSFRTPRSDSGTKCGVCHLSVTSQIRPLHNLCKWPLQRGRPTNYLHYLPYRTWVLLSFFGHPIEMNFLDLSIRNWHPDLFPLNRFTISLSYRF